MRRARSSLDPLVTDFVTIAGAIAADLPLTGTAMAAGSVRPSV